MDKISVWIWGIGEAGKLLYNICKKDKSFIIKGIIDEGKINEVYDGIIIENFIESRKKITFNDLVIVCCQMKNYSTIKKRLDESGVKNYKHFYDIDFSSYLYKFFEVGSENRCISKVCTEYDYEKAWFRKIARKLGECIKVKHRKLWEWVYIVHVLEECGVLKEGNSAIGYAVGCEPLPSYFASKGIEVLATDLSMENMHTKGWAETNQHAGGNLEKLYYKRICSKDKFDNKVKYRDVDMNNIPDDIGEYDFCWSSCAIEHIGSLDLSKKFLKNMIKSLKPGGVAIHTTEFNILSNTDTVTEGYSVIFRKKDFEELKEWFNEQGVVMELSFRREKSEGNSYIDIPPYKSEGKPFHFNLCADGFVETSYAIVIKKKCEEA